MTEAEGKTSMEWIRRAAEYRVLIGKRDALGCPLGEPDMARLEELERFFGHDANRRRMPWTQREQLRVAIHLVVQLGDLVGFARDISGDGMFIETSRPLAPGEHVVVRINEAMQRGLDGFPFVDEEPATVEEWRFSAEVVRIDAAGMGLRLVGMPLSLRISHHSGPTTPIQHAA